MKGIDKTKHALNIERTKLALQEKRLEVYRALNAKEESNELRREINESKIKILQLENKIIKHG